MYKGVNLTLKLFGCFFRHGALEPSVGGGAKSIHVLLCFFHAVDKLKQMRDIKRTIE